jgi:hypothetical protein
MKRVGQEGYLETGGERDKEKMLAKKNWLQKIGSILI